MTTRSSTARRDLPAVPVVDGPTSGRRVVTGQVRSLVLRPRGATAAFEVDLTAGSEVLTLVWLGRRRIGGIDTGRWLRAEGRVTMAAGGPTMYNPAYTLLASGPHD